MSDEPVPEVQPESVTPEHRSKRSYTDEDRYIALAAVDLNGGNVYRTSVALGIPATTLYDWVNERIDKISHNQANFANGRREKRGDLSTKLEDKVHSLVESITPEVIEKATLAQRFVAIGIGCDKVRDMRHQGLEPDPATELCKLLGINRTELPERLELGPGEELPSGFGFTGPVIEAETVDRHSTPVEPLSQEIYTYACNSCDYQVNVPAYLNAQDPNHGPFPCDSCHRGSISLVSEPAQLIHHQPGCDLNIPCSCGAHDKLIQNQGVKMTQEPSQSPPEDVTDGDAKLLEGIDDDDSTN